MSSCPASAQDWSLVASVRPHRGARPSGRDQDPRARRAEDMLNRLLDTVTVLALIAVITIGGRMMWERWQQNAAQRDREIDGWQTLALDGHRMGPQDASVVIMEWGDYQ